jgi:hypothetical protein
VAERRLRLIIDKTRRRSLAAALLVALIAGTSGTASSGGTALPSRAAGDPWSDYNAIMWQPHRAEQCAALKDIGITAGAIIPRDRDDPASSLNEQISPFLACGLSWYVENIATDFYAAYHRWSPDHPVNWRFVEAKRAYQENPHDPAALRREPSLSDPRWLGTIRTRLEKTVRTYRAHRPLYYSLADEAGIADLSAFWDFDFSSDSLKDMRHWLRQQYGSLARLNRQWDSHFADWNAVTPMTTAAAMQRTDENYSAWADFKAWMDVAFARALATGTRAVHAADRTARAAFEGGQIPGWGGYDYSRLAKAVDVMELYDGGGNVEILRSLNPGAIILTTSFGKGPREIHEIWRELLRGSRGVILWDPQEEIVTADGTAGDRGRDLAATLRDIRSGLGSLFIHSHRETAPIAILYSPASMRVQWMVDWRSKGDAWSARDPNSVYEDDSAVRSSMTRFFGLLRHIGIEPRVLASESIEQGELQRGKFRVLILPRVLSLSRAEAREIRRFVAAGGVVIADGEPGRFDQHGRHRQKPPLADLFRNLSAPDGQAFGKGRVISFPPDEGGNSGRDPRQFLRQTLAAARVTPAIEVLGNDHGAAPADVELSQWHNGAVTVIALQRDLPDPPRSNPDLAEQVPGRLDRMITVKLPRPAFLYDLIEKKPLGHGDRFEVRLDPLRPTILAASPEPRQRPRLSGPRRARPGEVARLRLETTPNDKAAATVIHVDVIDPLGKPLRAFGENLLLHHGVLTWTFRIPPTAQPGKWQIRVADVSGGGTTVWEIDIRGLG